MLKKMFLVLAIGLTCIAAIPVQAADFPEKEVQIIIPWAPGGATDLIFRPWPRRRKNISARRWSSSTRPAEEAPWDTWRG